MFYQVVQVQWLYLQRVFVQARAFELKPKLNPVLPQRQQESVESRCTATRHPKKPSHDFFSTQEAACVAVDDDDDADAVEDARRVFDIIPDDPDLIETVVIQSRRQILFLNFHLK